MLKEEWGPSQKVFEKILSWHKADPYAMLSIGNIYQNARDKAKEKAEKVEYLFVVSGRMA
jgi:hypothetical protein